MGHQKSKILLSLVLILAVAYFLTFTTRAIRYPYSLDYVEGPLVDQAVRLANGENVYPPDWSRPPYTVSTNPPIFIALLAPAVKIFGPAFWFGRLISTLSALLAAMFIVLIFRKISKNTFAALIAGGVFLAIPFVVYWSGLCRNDMLALVFSLAGFWVFIRWPEHIAALLGAGILLLMAVYTRQTYGLAVPLTIR